MNKNMIFRFLGVLFLIKYFFLEVEYGVVLCLVMVRGWINFMF